MLTREALSDNLGKKFRSIMNYLRITKDEPESLSRIPLERIRSV